MSLELLNTSAPRGVRPGATGFCTVGVTNGVSPALEERLLLLSGYRWLVPPGEKGAENNPVSHAHWRLMVGGRTLSVLSRVCDAGFDYSRRSNRFAHHVALEPPEQAEAGPAWVMMQPGVMRTNWVGEPMVFEEGPDIPTGKNPPRICQAWATASGDAGWAGVLAASFAADPSQVSSLIYPLGLDLLPLIDEAIALLPAGLRWQVTFSTYFTDLPAGMACAWRCCAAGTRAAADALRQVGSGTLIDLTQPLPPAPQGPLVDLARGGIGAPAAGVLAADRSVFPASTMPHAGHDLGGKPRAAMDAATHLHGLSLESSTAAGDEPEAIEESSRPHFFAETGALSPLLVDEGNVANSGADRPPSAGLPGMDSASGAAPSEGDLVRSSGAPSSSPATQSRDTARRGRGAVFWTLALAWPVIVAGAAIAYVHFRDSASEQAARGRSGLTPDPAHLATALSAPPPETPRTTAPSIDATSAVPLATHNATTQKLASAQKSVDAQKLTIAQLRANLTEIKDELSAARIGAQGSNALQAEYEKLKADYKLAQSKLAAATQPVTPAEHAVELFRDEFELWAGDGNGPPDALLLESYPPPDGLLIERSPGQILFKNTATSAIGDARPVPVELAIIKIDGPRVVLSWIAANRGQISTATRAWLQLSRLSVLRRGQTVSVARFLPRHSATIHVDHETPTSLLPEVRWKDAVKHTALAAPTTMPAGWSAKQKDPRIVTIVSAGAPDAAFDVQLSVADNGDVQAQTTYAATYYKVQRISEDLNAVAGKKAAMERAAQKVKDLADDSGTKARDAAKQADFDAARRVLETATAAARDAEGARAAGEAALGALRELPVFSLPVVNHENGLVLCQLWIKRGQ